MNRKYLVILVLLVTITVSHTLGELVFAYYHEDAHRQIYRNFGCEATIEVDFWGGLAIPEEGCNRTPEMAKYHALNEIVGYHLNGILFNVWTMFMIFILVYWVRR